MHILKIKYVYLFWNHLKRSFGFFRKLFSISFEFISNIFSGNIDNKEFSFLKLYDDGHPKALAV